MNARQVSHAAGLAVTLCACSASPPDQVTVGATMGGEAIAAVEQAIPAEMTVADAAAAPVITSLAGRAEVVTRFGTVGVFSNEDEGISYLTYNGDASALGGGDGPRGADSAGALA